MKKTFLTTAIISALLISCNDTKNENRTTEESTEIVEKEHTKEIASESHDAMSNTWVEEIILDEGNKWEANMETTEGVDEMLKLVKSSKEESVEEYHKLASELNETKNFVVKKCTMKGASHDNLHVFLHPLIEKINALGKVSTAEEGAKIKESIQENLENYYNYFQ